MAQFTISGLTFTYPGRTSPALKGLSFNIESGQFISFVGPSGCGKTTLLRHLKPALTPHGARTGEILFDGMQIEKLGRRAQSEKIGFVCQSPDNQIVTDKVWHELAFGLESLGYKTAEIRLRVAEMASFFGIQAWFYKNVTELSGGQKQLLNLASIMAMQPSVLILDEPTGQLDPIAAADFLAAVGKINRELGITVIMTEHRLEEVFPMSDRVICMDKGEIICDGAPAEVGLQLRERGHGMFLAMPAPMRIYAGVKNDLPCPVTVRDGRAWLDNVSKDKVLAERAGHCAPHIKDNAVIELSDVWFRYERDLPDVVKGLSLKVNKGDFLCILGGNGTGKTTMLTLVSGIGKPYRGKVKLFGEEIGGIGSARLFGGMLGVLPQNPQSLFVKKTVYEDLLEILPDKKMAETEKERIVRSVSAFCRIEALLFSHPYDLSGGEQQRAALAKVLLLKPRVLLLDEPTKGLDAEFKQEFAAILRGLNRQGVTIVMVSHDIEFCAEHAKRCAMFFDGNIVSEGAPREFFAGNSFYTTAANRMARHVLPGAVTAEDVIAALGGAPPPHKEIGTPYDGRFGGGQPPEPSKDAGGYSAMTDQPPDGKRALTGRTLAAAGMILAAIPLTIYFGIYFLDDRRYYFISMLIILETMLPFVLIFENRRPQARELVILAVMCAIGVAGRVAFFMLPQFKPVVALVIISGVAFGGEAGFLVGAMTAFLSNMFFGQGPWTPWQMFALGIIGFLSGVLFRKGILRRSRMPLCIFGGIATFLIYGVIMDTSAVLVFQEKVQLPMLFAAYLQGIPLNLVHGAATVTFLWIISQPMLEKLDRIKVKYGLVE